MPAPSVWAKRLAADLKEVGEILGFDSTTEEAPVEGSDLKIDVVWKLQVDKIMHTSSPLPKDLVIVSIEIQYSDSISSISHGVIKAQHAGSPYHIIVSYKDLKEDFKEALRGSKSRGLKIIDGKDVTDLQLWISHLLSKPSELKEKGRKTLEELTYIVEGGSVDVTEQIRETMKKEVELMFAPKKITELLGALAIDDTRNALAIESALKSTFHSIQSWLSKYAISTCVTFSCSLLFSKPLGMNCSFDRNAYFYIYADRVEINNNGYAFELEINGRNVKAIRKNPEMSFYESIPTERVKTFTIVAMEYATSFIKQFNVTDKDLTELDQITEVLNNTSKELEID